MEKLLFAAFEGLPFIKTGGLADVIYALPKALNKDKYDIKVVLPLHKKIKDEIGSNLSLVTDINIETTLLKDNLNIYKYKLNNIEYIFIDSKKYLNRENVYGYEDDLLRYAVFNLSIMEMMIKTNYYPNIIHTHDYHTAMIPALCKYKYFDNENIYSIKHIYTIHNLSYQGIYDTKTVFKIYDIDEKYKDFEAFKFNEYCNFMKVGITTSDIITTVSNNYSNEIQTKEYGENLQDVLKNRRDSLYGIVNGIDIETWNPQTDSIPCNYSVKDFIKGKLINKTSIQKELGLNNKPSTFLVGMVSRLAYQKGAKLLIESYKEILEKDVQLIVLGTGDDEYEKAFREMANNYKGKAVFYCGYNEALAHRVYAGIDCLLMPSLFEPCGISQLIAMRYGTLPLVRETGGLKDTVEPYNCFEKTGRGFSFAKYDSNDLLKIFNYAYETFNNYHDDYNILIKSAMNYDVSFNKSAVEYEKIYDSLID